MPGFLDNLTGDLFRSVGELVGAMAREQGGDQDQADDGRPSLEDILENYQVEADELVSWPGGLLSPFSRTVTKAEAEMLDELGLWEAQGRFQDIHDMAFDEADERYPSDDRNDDHNDAFRHAYWNALLTREYGYGWTQAFTTHHEMRPGNPPEQEAMDLYNNQVGRDIALNNPDASDEELAELVAEAVNSGETVVVPEGGGRLEWSDRIGPDETGDPTLPPPEGPEDGTTRGGETGVGSGTDSVDS